MIKEPQTLDTVYIYIYTQLSFADVESVYLAINQSTKVRKYLLGEYTLENRANEVSFVYDEKNILKRKAICR